MLTACAVSVLAWLHYNLKNSTAVSLCLQEIRADGEAPAQPDWSVNKKEAGIVDRTWSALLPAPPLQTTQQTLLSGINSLHFAQSITHHEKHPEIWREAKFLLYTNRGTISYANWGWLWQFEHCLMSHLASGSHLKPCVSVCFVTKLQ